MSSYFCKNRHKIADLPAVGSKWNIKLKCLADHITKDSVPIYSRREASSVSLPLWDKSSQIRRILRCLL